MADLPESYLMKRLTEVMKRRIVEHLACYRSHAETATLLNEEFGVSLTLRHIRAYDPNTFQFAGSAHWIDYHRLVREKFAMEIKSVAISHRAYRLDRLQELFYDAKDNGHLRQAAKILEQAAKEVGYYYDKASANYRR